MSFLVTGQVSKPYNRVDITRVRNTHILICLLRLWLRRPFFISGTLSQLSQSLWPFLSLLSHFAAPDFLDMECYSHLQYTALEGDSCLVCFQVISNCEYLSLLHIAGHAPMPACSIQYIQHVLEFTSCFCSQCQVIDILDVLNECWGFSLVTIGEE